MYRKLNVHKFQAKVWRVAGVGVGLDRAKEVEVIIEGVLYQPAVKVVAARQELVAVVNEGNVAPCQSHLVLRESKERAMCCEIPYAYKGREMYIM